MIKLNLSKRLFIISSLIGDNSNVIDIGCDHALLDIYLTNNRKNISCTAVDINDNALKVAKNNIKKNELENKIKTIKSDGLLNVDVPNNCIIVISGMGTGTIKHILNCKKSMCAKQIIIQSNNQLYELRKFMTTRGYVISCEYTIEDKNKYYAIISFTKGNNKYKKDELLYGPFIIKNDNGIHNNYLKHLLKKERKIYDEIPNKHLILKMKKYYSLKKIMGYIK